MRLIQLHIQNYRSCRDITLEISGMHALVGSNNAGKSTVLRALDFLFNPSTKKLNEESFWNKDIKLEIKVEAIFSELNDNEKKELNNYLNTDGKFHMARSAKIGTEKVVFDTDAEYTSNDIIISQYYKSSLPKVEWLQEKSINGNKIKGWWVEKEQLVVNGISFSEFINKPKAPAVADWKNKAREFVALHKDNIPMSEEWIENPKGYANVLKGILPFFILIPAVRDVTEESKGTKNSPFGRLIYAILDGVADDKRKGIDEILCEVAGQMNRAGGDKRVALISDTENQLNTFLNEIFSGCDIEIEFQTPTLEVLLSTPKLYVDDGFRNIVENKGHGLQRAVIFSILRRYAEHMTASEDGKKRNLILAVEEPELYMHPQAQRTIRKVFRKIAESGDQVFLSTHSSLLVEVSFFDEIIRMECNCEKADGKRTMVSSAWQLPISKMIKDLESRLPDKKGNVTSDSMRELYSHAYNPLRNEGFFASKIILVEGLTEEYALPIYADAIPNYAFDPKGISVISCGGKGSIDRLFRIFNEFHIPCYILFDYDKGSSDTKIIEKSKELLALAGHPQNAPETIIINNRITCFCQSWEKDLSSEIPKIEELTKKAREELGLNGDSGKPLVARYIAKEITSQDPPVIPPSIKKIIEKAVEVSWNGSCLK